MADSKQTGSSITKITEKTDFETHKGVVSSPCSFATDVFRGSSDARIEHDDLDRQILMFGYGGEDVKFLYRYYSIFPEELDNLSKPPKEGSGSFGEMLFGFELPILNLPQILDYRKRQCAAHRLGDLRSKSRVQLADMAKSLTRYALMIIITERIDTHYGKELRNVLSDGMDHFQRNQAPRTRVLGSFGVWVPANRHLGRSHHGYYVCERCQRTQIVEKSSCLTGVLCECARSNRPKFLWHHIKPTCNVEGVPINGDVDCSWPGNCRHKILRRAFVEKNKLLAPHLLPQLFIFVYDFLGGCTPKPPSTSTVATVEAVATTTNVKKKRKM